MNFRNVMLTGARVAKVGIRNYPFGTASVMAIFLGSLLVGSALMQDEGPCPKHCPPGQHNVSTGPKGCECVPDTPNLPPPTTKVGQALVSIGNMTYEFAVDDKNGHVVYTSWQLRGGSAGWIDLGQPAGGVLASTNPAASAAGNYIFVTVTGSDGRIYLNQGTPPNWVGWH